MKICLSCNEIATPAEEKCGSCGGELGRAYIEEKPSPARLRPAFLIVPALLGIILVVWLNRTNGVEVREGVPRSETESPRPAYYDPPVISVTAEDLYTAYDANEIAADARFKGKLLSVSGQVNSIGKDILGEPYVTLKTSHAISSVQCMFPKSSEPSLAGLSKGSNMTIKGQCSGKLGNVILRDCSFF